MRIEKIETEADRIVAEELETAKRCIIENHIAAGQRVTGATAGSIVTSVVNAGGTIVGAIDAREYFAALETGTRPWKNPYYRQTKDGRMLPAPPKWFRDIIAEWLLHRGCADFSPWLVAGKIMTEGAALFRDGGREDIFSNEIPQLLDRIAGRLAGLYDAQIIESILRK